MYRFKITAKKTNFRFVKTAMWPKLKKKKKKKKKTFPKEFSNKIWLKVGKHKYIYISEIKLENKYSV